MSDLPNVNEQFAMLIVTLRRNVFPETFFACVELLEEKYPPRAAVARALLQKTQAMTDDAELRFWLTERATVEEAVTVSHAIDVALGAAAGPQATPQNLALLGRRLLAAPLLLTVLRIGLAGLTAMP